MYSSYIACRLVIYLYIVQVEFLLRNYKLSEKGKGSETSGIEFINIRVGLPTLHYLSLPIAPLLVHAVIIQLTNRREGGNREGGDSDGEIEEGEFEEICFKY
jgi:hypothetical protein